MPPISTVGTAKPVSEVFVPPQPTHFWRACRDAIVGLLRSPARETPRTATAREPRPHPDGPQDDPTATRDAATNYFQTLASAWHAQDWTAVNVLFCTLRDCWAANRQVFLCGNGGSAANAIHLANDLLYGVDKSDGRGLRVTALPANASVLTCLANDVSYADIFARQLRVLAQPGDILITFSGSGNSPNIVNALSEARALGVTSFAILGFSGGRAREIADHPIHFHVHDMQIAEDLQMMVGHMAMQWLSRNRPPRS